VPAEGIVVRYKHENRQADEIEDPDVFPVYMATDAMLVEALNEERDDE
jgi:hypothetical protein